MISAHTPFAITSEQQKIEALEHIERLLRRLSETAQEIEALITAVRVYEGLPPAEVG
ncbi:hypothetical protein ABIE41_000424 [Bosea sp. OAE506]|uniref:hypothetical protein n=1 Tax=Bosea sp. OAE506 TaxID=2663870 RepID=UPI00178B9434